MLSRLRHATVGAMDILRDILVGPIEPAPWTSLEDFWRQHQPIVRAATSPVDAAILGGFRSEILATAFAAGYQAALAALFPKLPQDQIVSLCVTERGGGHPRAILTRIEPYAPGVYSLSGEKRWSTLAPRANWLLVVAREGEDAATHRAQFRIVWVDARTYGVTIVPMPETPFVPEIPHAEITFNGVTVDAADLLPGDGYEDYVKPFRTVEDIFVHAAGAGYLIRLCRQYNLGASLLERLVFVVDSLHRLSQRDPKDPRTHIVLAGLLQTTHAILTDVEEAFAKAAPEAHAKFLLDKPIFAIASRVRAERANKAWERLSR